MDHLLERSLEGEGLRRPDNFIVIVNGKDKTEEIIEQTESSRFPLKILKLHGTLESPKSYAFTEDEIFDFTKEIKPILSQFINKSLIIIGHSMQDRDIDVLFESEGKEIHLVKPSLPEPRSRISQILSVRSKGNVISGEDSDFDTFFQKLKLYLEEEVKDAENLNSKQSIEGFLRGIGYEHELGVPQSRYKNISTLYVKPTEYDSICSKLEKDHVVFIIGEPHLGKTYTAIYILWEYYQKGYETLHIRHDQLITLLYANNSDSEKLLSDLITKKKSESLIIHFDDPFGETTERRASDFAKGLNGFLDLSKKYEHLRIIVTTRLNIFRESLAKYNYENIEELEKDLRVHTSYQKEVLLDILHRYTLFYNPLWSSNKDIVHIMDEKIPIMLPAPHNIEFFVRTSENLNSLDEVLEHVEKSKEMIVALGDWMINLPSHEQIFLVWVEILSTSNVIFYNKPSSQINLVDAYRVTLSYLYKKGHIEGILNSSYYRAKDKFDMILLESQNKEANLTKFDFVHPSYHEAFWYAVKKESRLFNWWQIIKENATDILKDLQKDLDRVQIRMIENYGNVNRDLDKLLIISAESDDINEKAIALEYIMERPEKFTKSPSFFPCAKSVILSENPYHRRIFANSFDNCFDQLSDETLDASLPLIFDKYTDIQQKAFSVISNTSHFFELNRRSNLKIWPVLKKLKLFEIIKEAQENSKDQEIRKNETSIYEKFLLGSNLSLKEIFQKHEYRISFCQINLSEFRVLFQNNLKLGIVLVYLSFLKEGNLSFLNERKLSENLTSEQKNDLKSITRYAIEQAEIIQPVDALYVRRICDEISNILNEDEKPFFSKIINKLRHF